MPKEIYGPYRCRECGFLADGKTWNLRILREQPGLFGTKAWYACPNCNKEVELDRA